MGLKPDSGSKAVGSKPRETNVFGTFFSFVVVLMGTGSSISMLDEEDGAKGMTGFKGPAKGCNEDLMGRRSADTDVGSSVNFCSSLVSSSDRSSPLRNFCRSRKMKRSF